MFTVTDKAVAQIQKAIQDSGEPELSLRIAAQYKEDKKIHYLIDGPTESYITGRSHNGFCNP